MDNWLIGRILRHSLFILRRCMNICVFLRWYEIFECGLSSTQMALILCNIMAFIWLCLTISYIISLPAWWTDFRGEKFPIKTMVWFNSIFRLPSRVLWLQSVDLWVLLVGMSFSYRISLFVGNLLCSVLSLICSVDCLGIIIWDTDNLSSTGYWEIVHTNQAD